MKKKVRRKKAVFGTSDKPRLVVFRSLRYIYGQVVDDSQGKTLLGASSKTREIRNAIGKAKTPTEASRIVGEYIAKKSKEKKITRIVFDRNGYAYHGRVKALADGARKGGLEF